MMDDPALPYPTLSPVLYHGSTTNEKGLDLGGNVNLDEGWPLYYLGNSFHECLPPDYAGDDYEPCTTIEKDHVSLEW